MSYEWWNGLTERAQALITVAIMLVIVIIGLLAGALWIDDEGKSPPPPELFAHCKVGDGNPLLGTRIGRVGQNEIQILEVGQTYYTYEYVGVLINASGVQCAVGDTILSVGER